MPTPSQHSIAVDTFLTRNDNSSLTPPLNVEYLAAEVHAHLSQAAGTGDDYTTADTLLTTAESLPVISRERPLRLALIHAVRADR